MNKTHRYLAIIAVFIIFTLLAGCNGDGKRHVTVMPEPLTSTPISSTPSPEPDPTPEPESNYKVSRTIYGTVLSASAISGPYSCEIVVEIESCWTEVILLSGQKDAVVDPADVAEWPAGKVITAVTKEDASQLSGQRIKCVIDWNKLEKINFAFAFDVIKPPDTTPPPPVTNLTTTSLADGNIALEWDICPAEDFHCYNVYMSTSEIYDVVGVDPVAVITTGGGNSYLAKGLELDRTYYFIVTAVDGNSNESMLGSCVYAVSAAEVAFDNPVVLAGSDVTVERDFTWEYGGIKWTWHASIAQSLYQTFHSKPRPRTDDYSVYVTCDGDENFFTNLGEIIRTNGENLGYTDTQILETAIVFVQTIPYTYDIDTTGQEQYAKYPIETLYDGSVDCEDFSILLAQLLDCMGYDVIMLEFDTKPIGHAAIAIADPGDVYGTYYTLNGRKYYFVETTYAGWDIGEIDEKYSQLYVQIYELYPIPVLGWEQWEYETYGWTMTLDVTVYNDGTAPAEGVRIYAYLDAGGGRCYDDTEATVSLQPGEKRVVTLNLQISGGSVYTRLGFYITHEGISVGESYSDWFNW